MKQSQSTIRLAYYVLAGMLSAFAGGVMTVDFSDWRNGALFIAAIFTAGITAARGYIDQTPSRVESPTNKRTK